VFDSLTHSAIRPRTVAHSACTSLLSTEGTLGLSHTIVGLCAPSEVGMEAPMAMRSRTAFTVVGSTPRKKVL